MFNRVPSRRTCLTGILIADLLILPFLYLLLPRRNTPPPFIAEHPYFLYDLDVHEHRNSGQKCVLPRVHPFHPSIWNYFAPPKDIVCRTRQLDLTYISSDGFLKYNETELERNGYKANKNMFCHWSTVLRAGDYQDDDDDVIYGYESMFNPEGNELPPDYEAFQVECWNFAGFTIYDKLHVRVRNITMSDQYTYLQKPTNVLIFGLDSMSRLGFMRLLPRTYKYLTEKLRMTVFRGMNKIGDNTYPNLVALLTG
ncbi:hypothetical protein HNY73_004476 [Argiope bruennichi]|uniref:Uncharacterized protein n=1 Tax=Argiope bruennichi TaxID=94029 RepID=A0A8T0FRX9_ARGBR|nr:hypothetical protein HNY73_004476 [Argiope bruennichi]